MCMAIPLRVQRMEGHFAVCEGRNGVERVDTLLTGPLEPGEWVLAFLGSARERIDELRAAQVGAAIDAVQAALQSTAGADLDQLLATHFSDLVDREPQLPDFLRPTTVAAPAAAIDRPLPPQAPGKA